MGDESGLGGGGGGGGGGNMIIKMIQLLYR